MKNSIPTLLGLGAVCVGLLASAPLAQAQFSMPAEFDFGTGTGQDDLTGFDTPSTRMDVALVADGINLSRDPLQNFGRAKVYSEFSPLSSQNQNFEMNADVLFNNSFERGFQRVGLIGFAKDEFDQGLGFVLFRDNNGVTQVGFQNGALGGNRFDLVEKNGLQAGSLAGNTLSFDVDGDWDGAASEWTFTLTVTDPDNTTTSTTTTLDAATPSNNPNPELLTGTNFGMFGSGPNSDDVNDIMVDVTFDNFAVVPEPSLTGAGLGAVALLSLLVRRRVRR